MIIINYNNINFQMETNWNQWKQTVMWRNFTMSSRKKKSSRTIDNYGFIEKNDFWKMISKKPHFPRNVDIYGEKIYFSKSTQNKVVFLEIIICSELWVNKMISKLGRNNDMYGFVDKKWFFQNDLTKVVIFPEMFIFSQIWVNNYF